MRCDQVLDDARATYILFQSLSGFLMRCDQLQDKVTSVLILFQSLSGFLMRCDSGADRPEALCPRVSIPIGFSDAL